MKCSKCGKENRPGLSVCTQCGAGLAAANPFQKPGDLTSAEKDGVDTQPKASPVSKVPTSKGQRGFFWNPGDLSEGKTAEKTMSHQPRHEAGEHAGPTDLSGVNRDVDRSDNGKTSNTHAPKQNKVRSKDRKTTAFSKKKWLAAAACGVLAMAVVACLAIFRSSVILTKTGAQRLMDDAVNQTVQTMGESNILRDTLSEHLKITMLSLERTADGYQGVCSVRSVDCSDVLITYFSGISGDEVATGSEILARLELVVDNAPVVEREFVVTFIRTDSGYTPVFTEEMVNYCSGNMHLVQAYLIERMEQEGVQ